MWLGLLGSFAFEDDEISDLLTGFTGWGKAKS